MTVKGPLFKGETGKAITYTLKDTDGTAFNLTGYTITLIVRVPGGAEEEKSMSIVSASAGTCRWTTTSDDNLDTLGNWDPTIRCVSGTTKVYFKPQTKEDGIYVEDPKDT